MDGSCEWSLGGKRPLPNLTEPQLATPPPCLAWSQLPAQLSPTGAFPMRGAEEEHTAGPTACSLFLQGLASWGVLQASSLYSHLPH